MGSNVNLHACAGYLLLYYLALELKLQARAWSIQDCTQGCAPERANNILGHMAFKWLHSLLADISSSVALEGHIIVNVYRFKAFIKEGNSLTQNHLPTDNNNFNLMGS